MKRKGQKQNGNRERKCRPLRLTEISGGTLWRPYVPRGTNRIGEVWFDHFSTSVNNVFRKNTHYVIMSNFHQL